MLSRLVRPLGNKHLHHIQEENDRVFGSCGRRSLCNSALSILMSTLALCTRNVATANAWAQHVQG